MKDAKEYYTTHAETFEKFPRIGYTSVNVLQFLIGKPWDDVALGYVHSLRPSYIRVITSAESARGECTCDARTWRVTVTVSKENIIEGIRQEVEVGLPSTVVHGQALTFALAHGVNSPQCQWFNDDIEFVLYEPSGTYKKTKVGLIPFPDESKD